MAKVVVLGSANVDLVFRCGRLPGAGETILGDSFDRFAGGKGANQAVASARMGASTQFIACLGADGDGDWLLAGLRVDGVETDSITRGGKPTGVASICVDPQGRNQIVVAPGANSELRAIPVEAETRVALAQLEVPLPTVSAFFAEAAKSGVPYRILNPAPALPLGRCLANVIVPNETEAAILTGAENPEEAAELLLAQGFEHVLITLGERGVLYVTAETRVFVPAPVVEPVDTVAAGDVFCGALAAFLSEGMTMLDAIKLAVQAASISVTRPGAQASIPRRGELTP